MNLTKGEYYIFNRKDSSFIEDSISQYFIGIYDYDYRFSKYVFTPSKFYNSSGYSFTGKETPINIRLATPKEREYLNACIKANKYVEMPKETNLIEEFNLF